MSWTTRQVLRRGAAYHDAVAEEEPLEIRVEGHALAVLMRTPGHDEELAAGFLLTEGIIEDRTDIARLALVRPNVIDCRLASGVQAHLEQIRRAERKILATSACGICGRAQLDRVRLRARRPHVPIQLSAAQLHRLPTALAAEQETFRHTGGVHGAALVDPSGTLVVIREDVGRHNAADKVLGWALRHEPGPHALLVSSRAGFEIVQKARLAGIGTVLALGAASSLAIDLAHEEGMVLIGFLRQDGYTRYTGGCGRRTP